MRILVKYDKSYYYWVDTVTMLDDSIYAILISNKGAPLPVRLDKIEVVDDSYNYEKQIEKRIAELKSKSSWLKTEMAVAEKLREL